MTYDDTISAIAFLASCSCTESFWLYSYTFSSPTALTTGDTLTITAVSSADVTVDSVVFTVPSSVVSQTVTINPPAVVNSTEKVLVLFYLVQAFNFSTNLTATAFNAGLPLDFPLNVAYSVSTLTLSWGSSVAYIGQPITLLGQSSNVIFVTSALTFSQSASTTSSDTISQVTSITSTLTTIIDYTVPFELAGATTLSVIVINEDGLEIGRSSVPIFNMTLVYNPPLSFVGGPFSVRASSNFESEVSQVF